MKNLKKQVGGAPFENPWISHISAVILYVLMIAIERYATPSTVVSPLITMIALGIIAYMMRPGYVVAWGIIFLLTTFYFLFHLSRPLLSTEVATAWIRFCTILLGGIGAVFLSYEKKQLSERYLQVLDIMEKLPVPVIISDSKGCVVYMNNGATELLNTSMEDAYGASYFSYVAAAEKGRMVQKYFDFLDGKESILHEVPLNIKKPTGTTGMATIVAISGNSEKYLATVISTKNKSLYENTQSPCQ